MPAGRRARALGGFRVHDLNASLSVLGEGNRDYSASYTVSNLLGSFTADNIPIHRLDGIHGDVSLIDMAYQENRSTGSGPDGQTARSESPRASIVRDIHGNLTARFCRADLALDQIEGRIDVQNDFGNVDWIVTKKLAQNQDHRIASQSGSIDIRLDEKASASSRCLSSRSAAFSTLRTRSMVSRARCSVPSRETWCAVTGTRWSAPSEPPGSMIRWRVSRHSGAWPMPFMDDPESRVST